MAIEIVEFSIKNGGSFQFVMWLFTRGYLKIFGRRIADSGPRTPEGELQLFDRLGEPEPRSARVIGIYWIYWIRI
jgi:hypothetical protein